MKKRKGTRRKPRPFSLSGIFGRKAVNPRRSWIFEKLEDRCYFTAAPNANASNLNFYSISSSTPEGQALLRALELSWATQTASAGAGDAGAASSSSESPRFAPYALPAFSDPYFNFQWHLLNVGQVVNPGQFQDLHGVPGQDVNVIPAWQLFDTQGRPIDGTGVIVGVVDTGVQLNHPDLVGNLIAGWDAITNRPGGQVQGNDPHGTAVAGLIGALLNNSEGGSGVAPGASLMPIRFLGGGATESTFINAITAGGAPVDIFNHSWGPNFDFYGRNVAGPTDLELLALTNSVLFGRNGLGVIHVFASGNSAEELHSPGSNGWVNSRYTIGVGIVDHDGQRANSDGTSTGYGEVGPSVLIVAPSASGPIDIINNFDTGSGLFTTDQTGDNGYNVGPLPNGTNLDIDNFPDTDYTSRMGGTSGAAPLVSGVIALMLQANPNLSWRDVQEILVRSARQNDDLDDSWITNLVPIFRDPQSGFGDTTNDEIQYRAVPETGILGAAHPNLITPAIQASTGEVFFGSAGNFFNVTAAPEDRINGIAVGNWDGKIANNLKVTFRWEEGDIPGARAEIMTPTQLKATLDRFGGGGFFTSEPTSEIRITVTGNGVTWGEIADAVYRDPMDPFDFTGLRDYVLGVFTSSDFIMTVDDPDEVFDPAVLKDLSGGAPLEGGEDGLYLGTETNPLVLRRLPQFNFNYNPLGDPILSPAPPSLFTNGAGYTVSHGRNANREYGWAHGVVNAELAVQLAQQWHIKGQDLPSEKTFLVGLEGITGIRGARDIEIAPNVRWIIPGAVANTGIPDYAPYFLEFFKTPTVEQGTAGDPSATPPTLPEPGGIDPDSLPFRQNNPPSNTRGTFIPFDVPLVDPVTNSSNLIKMESVEVKLTITGGNPQALNLMKVTLVSPDGTHSELTLNQYPLANRNYQAIPVSLVGTPGDSINDGGDFTWVYSTNRIWGERSDSKPLFDEYAEWSFNPFTGEREWRPTYQGIDAEFLVGTDQDGNQVLLNGQGWELHFENFAVGTDFGIANVQVAFHGSPIGSSTDRIERVLGKVGVDSGRFVQQFGQIVGANDGEFNFDRYVTSATPRTNSHQINSTVTNDGFGRTPYGGHEDIRSADPFQERFAGNITVYAYDNVLNQRVAEFVTGYDGNYYFDLPNNDRQATTGTLDAQNTTFSISATKNGGLSGILGNNIDVVFQFDSSINGALAFFDGDTLEVFVKDETVTWQTIKAAIERTDAVGLQNGLAQQFFIDGQQFNINRFAVTAADFSALFAVDDAEIIAALAGGVNGTYTIGIEDPLGRSSYEGTTQASSGVVTATNTDFTITTLASNTDSDEANGIKVEFIYNAFFTEPFAEYDAESRTIFVIVTDETTTWGTLATLIEQASLEAGQPCGVTVGDPGALFDRVNDNGLSLQLAGGAQKNYDQTWTIRIDHTDSFTREAARINQVTGKIEYFNSLNFLLDPGSIPVGEVVFTGLVSADLDGDGFLDPVDIGLGDVQVYADVNHSGKFELGEPFTFTTADGTYELHVASATPNTFSIGVVPAPGWTVTAPLLDFNHVYAAPGETVTGTNFLIDPPDSPTNIGNGQIFGFVFSDMNGDGERQPALEGGLPDMTVFIDANKNGQLDDGEISTTTNSAGAYTFNNVTPGMNIWIDVVADEPFVQTAPKVTFRHVVSISSGQVLQGVDFGVQNLAIYDFGDLYGEFFQTYGPNAAAHFVVPGFSLGARVDGEIRSRVLVETSPGTYLPSSLNNGIGDDANTSSASFDDEDGVLLNGGTGILYRGANTLTITVNGVGGYLQGWIDFNNDGEFGAGERIFTDLDLNPGTYNFVIQAPDTLEDGLQAAARFRWGTGGIDYFGTDIIGEVEDYLFNTVGSLAPVNGDFDGDQDVDDFDYNVWRQTYGSTTDLRADANEDNIVSILDYVLWRIYEAGFGGGGAAVAAVSTADSGSAAEVTASQVSVVEMAGPPLPVSTAQPLASEFDEEQPSVSATVTDSDSPAAMTTSSSPFVGFFQIDDRALSPVDSTSRVAQSASAGAAADDDSLLLDQLWAELGDEAVDDDAITNRFLRTEDENHSELAVAAVFEDQSQWWGL